MANPLKLLLRIRRSLTRCETWHPLLCSSLKARQQDSCLLFVPREQRDLQEVTTQTIASPTTCPWLSARSPSAAKSCIPPKQWKCQPRRIHTFNDEIPVIAGKQTSWPAGSSPDLCPCRTQNSSFSNRLPMTNAPTHPKTTCLQKYVSINNSDHLNINQLRRNKSNRYYYSYIHPEKVLRYGW